MCDKAILENGKTLRSVPHCYKNKNRVIKQLLTTLMH